MQTVPCSAPPSIPSTTRARRPPLWPGGTAPTAAGRPAPPPPERAGCGPDTWVLGHSVRYEPFHETGIRADAIASAVGESPVFIGFYDGHTGLASAPAL